jgi:uncharacterized membrane protein YkvI
MKLVNKLVLPILAISLIASSAFAMQKKRESKTNAAPIIDLYPDTKPLLQYTALTIAATHACLGLATLGNQGSIWRGGMNTLGLCISTIYYLNWYHTEYANPLVIFACALCVPLSAGYTCAKLDPQLIENK